MNIRLRTPATCSDGELKVFQQMVLAAGEVIAQGFVNRVRRARRLAFAFEGDALVGVAALKVPSENHRREVFRDAKSLLSSERFPLELGWVVVDEKYRGLGHSLALVKSLQDSDGQLGVFATSATSRVAMHRTLAKCGFSQSGEAYKSTMRPTELWLFVRPSDNGS